MNCNFNYLIKFNLLTMESYTPRLRLHSYEIVHHFNRQIFHFCTFRGVSICIYILQTMFGEFVKGSVTNFQEWVTEKLLSQWYGWAVMVILLLCLCGYSGYTVWQHFKNRVRTLHLIPKHNLLKLPNAAKIPNVFLPF